MFITPLLDLDNVIDAVLARQERRPVAGPQQLHVEETDSAYVLSALLPGVNAEDISLEVTGEGLKLSASRRNPAPEGFTPIRRERTSFTLERSWKTPGPIEADAAEATFEAGILKVTLPKAATVQPRKLTVKAA